MSIGIIDDWEGEWHTATICKTIHNGLLDLQRRGGMVFASPEDSHYRSESDFFIRLKGEKTKRRTPKQRKALNLKQQDALLKRMAGLS